MVENKMAAAKPWQLALVFVDIKGENSKAMRTTCYITEYHNPSSIMTNNTL